MSKLVDLTGKVYGRLTVISFHSLTKFKDSQWTCKCECGSLKIVRAIALKSGDTKSCGCLYKERSHLTTHGESHTSREYKIWIGLRGRCKNKNREGYGHYGGRGISVCERWNKYENFLSDMGRAPSHKHSIDRINVNGNYEPGNCRWATAAEQANNTTRNRIITHDGKSQNLKQWCDELGLKYKTICSRIIKRKWSPEKALEFTTSDECRNRTDDGNNL